nr:hypothetical protein MmNV_46 [Menippe mercenaria nudivirus]
MPSQGIKRVYIVEKLLKLPVVTNHLSKQEISYIKRYCHKNIPKKVNNSEEVRHLIEPMVSHLLEEKGQLFVLVKSTILTSICNAIDRIIKRRIVKNNNSNS